MRRSTAGGMVLSVAVLALGCQSLDPTPGDLVARLAVDPGMAPPAPAAGTPVVLLEIDVVGREVAIRGAPIPQPGATLRLERALARGRAEPPDHWVVVFSPDGSTPRYWCATADQAEIRFDVGLAGLRLGGRSVVLGALGSVRLPFEPSGQIRIYEGATRTLLAIYRFGERAQDPPRRIAS